jgi:hypothetical protein
MVLNNNTAEKVLSLVKTKGNYNCVEYCGCWSKNSVSFMITREKDEQIEAGFYIDIDNDFNILSFRRLSGLIARNIYGGAKNSGYKKVFDKFNYPIV